MSASTLSGPPPPPAYHHYQASALGRSLRTALHQLQQTGELSAPQSHHALALFDQSINAALAERVQADVVVSGRLDVYRHCDDIWTLVMRDVRLVGAEGMVVSPAVKQVAYEWRRKRRNK